MYINFCHFILILQEQAGLEYRACLSGHHHCLCQLCFPFLWVCWNSTRDL